MFASHVGLLILLIISCLLIEAISRLKDHYKPSPWSAPVGAAIVIFAVIETIYWVITYFFIIAKW